MELNNQILRNKILKKISELERELEEPIIVLGKSYFIKLQIQTLKELL